jgi:hypothetical protein
MVDFYQARFGGGLNQYQGNEPDGRLRRPQVIAKPFGGRTLLAKPLDG